MQVMQVMRERESGATSRCSCAHVTVPFFSRAYELHVPDVTGHITGGKMY